MVFRALGLSQKLTNQFWAVRRVGFQTTSACNLECTYCSAAADQLQDNELNTEEAKRFIADLRKINMPILFFTGGEPLLRDDLGELVQFASQQKLVTYVVTNGILLSHRRAFELKAAGLRLFHLSIDGSCEEIHAQARGYGTFEEILRGLENAVSTGVPVMVKTTVTKHNEHDLENIAVLLQNKGTKIWGLHVVVPCGRGASLPKSETFTSQELVKLMERTYQLADKYKHKLRIVFTGLPFYHVFSYRKADYNLWKKLVIRLKGGCPIVEAGMLYINADGSIKPCAHFPYALSDVNVRKQSIVDIYQTNTLLNQLRNKKNLKGKCSACKHLSICGGGCRAQVFAETGDFFKEDESCPFIGS